MPKISEKNPERLSQASRIKNGFQKPDNFCTHLNHSLQNSWSILAHLKINSSNIAIQNSTKSRLTQNYP